ncbi:MAG TPA: class I SAM-dependent methyltransferase [Burkholderiaceae bacterium]|nr:class I SAM-dependent methyltransferase [Burkholderiaceae bacterium]
MAPPAPEPHPLAAIARAFVDAAGERATKQGYLAWLPRHGTVLDVGCGGGAFLDVARAAGLGAIGIDCDGAAVAAARRNGHDVHLGDAVAVLRELGGTGARFHGALLAHVIEHTDGEGALRLLHAIAAVLAPGAPLVVATPDVRSHIVLSELFWLDPSHVRPYPRLLIERLGAAAGFDVSASFRDATTRPRRPWWRALLARLRSALSGVDKSGPQDAVVVLRRRA